jgi:hypothetical protein
MYRISEEVAHKILKNVRSPELGPMDITQPDPFLPKNLNSVGIIDCYAAIGTDFKYILEISYPFINPALPPIKGLDGYWLYRRSELMQPTEPFNVPRYLADPNIQNGEDLLDVTDCSIVLPNAVDKLTCISIMSFEKLIEKEPLLLDCLRNPIQ